LVRGDYAYISCENGISIVEIKNPAAPRLVSTLRTAAPDYETSLDLKGNYLYAPCGPTGMAIINVENKSAPQLCSYVNFRRPGYRTYGAQSVSLKDNYAFVAVEHCGVGIVDISDPLSPGQPFFIEGIGGTEDDFRDRTYGVKVDGNYLYVAYWTNGLAIVDLSRWPEMEILSIKDTRKEADKVVIRGDFAYIADEDGMLIMDVSDKRNPQEVKYIYTRSTAYIPRVAGNYFFCACSSAGVGIVDISDPRNPGEVRYLDVGGNTWAMDIKNDYLYVGVYRTVNDGKLVVYQLEGLTSIEKKEKVISESISLPYPNPFNPECYIPVGRMKDEAGRMKVKIYNILGQLVREIEISNFKFQISKSIYWDGKDSRGLEVPTGIYFYEVAGEGVRQMVVLK
jgi:hypothetical protein